MYPIFEFSVYDSYVCVSLFLRKRRNR